MKKVKQFILGTLVGLMVMGGCVTAYGSNGAKTIQAVYKNIKVVIDGKELKTDKEPFTYEGTTYLPVRAVAEAVGKEVKWDSATQTVILGKDLGQSESIANIKKETFNGMVYNVPNSWTEDTGSDSNSKIYYPDGGLVMLLFQDNEKLQNLDDEILQDLLLKTIGNSLTNYEVLHKRLDTKNGQSRLIAELKGTKTVGDNTATIEKMVVLPSKDGIVIATYFSIGAKNESSKDQFEKMIDGALGSQ